MKYTRDIIAILFVLGTLIALFVPTVNEIAAQILQTVSSIIIGYYFGAKQIPIFSAKKK